MASKKTGIILVAAVAVIAAGGYAFAWKRHADTVEKLIQASAIPYVNITYDDIRTEGFPLAVNTVLTNARIAVDAGAYYQEHAADTYREHSVGVNNLPVFTQWIETLTFQGDLVISQAPLSQAATVTYKDGIIKQDSAIDDAGFSVSIAADTLNIHADAPHININTFIAAFNNTIEPESGDTPAASGVLDIEGEGISFTPTDVEEPSLIDRLTLSIDSAGKKASGLSAGITGATLSSAAGNAYRTHYALLSKHKNASPTPFAHLAEEQTEPSDLAASVVIDGAPDDKTLVTMNLAYTHPDVTASITSERGFRAKGMVDTAFSGEFEVAESWHASARRDLGKYFSVYMKNPENWEQLKDMPLFKDGAVTNEYKDDPEKFASLMAQSTYRLLPRIHEFGKTTFSSSDISFKQPDGTLTPETFISFSFNTGLYGISANPDTKDPSRLRVVMTKHEALSHDISAYAKRALNAWNKLAPNSPNIDINDGFAEALAILVENLGAREDDSLILYVTQKPNMIYVGKRSFAEISGEAMLLLSPYLVFKPAALK